MTLGPDWRAGVASVMLHVPCPSIPAVVGGTIQHHHSMLLEAHMTMSMCPNSRLLHMHSFQDAALACISKLAVIAKPPHDRGA